MLPLSDSLHSFFRDYTILVPFWALIFAIVMKGIIHALKGKFSVARMFGSWGMPSAHSTFVIALATAMWLKHWPASDYFLICLVFSIIIIYDAMNVRYQAGLHAKAINEMTPNDGKELNETLGHTPIEAVAGWIVGFLSAVVLLGT